MRAAALAWVARVARDPRGAAALRRCAGRLATAAGECGAAPPRVREAARDALAALGEAQLGEETAAAVRRAMAAWEGAGEIRATGAAGGKAENPRAGEVPADLGA